MKTSHLLLIALAASLPSAVAANKPGALPRHGMLVYSDLCIHEGSGEYGGQRITLQRFAEVDTVIYEYTAGGLSWPLVATDVNVDPRGKMMYFTVQEGEEERTISGKFSRNGNVLTLDGAYCEDQSQPMVLTRVRDFARKPGACKTCPAPKR
ncbi:MAG: hypothetical protein K0R43_2416 [Pseudoduganella sp.]|jgi:hypothetical protein|nr:hypothetical protein [Pseudoduganella sp.]